MQRATSALLSSLSFFRRAEKALEVLNVESGKDPDPGSWSRDQVFFWMNSLTVSASLVTVHSSKQHRTLTTCVKFIII